MIWNPKLGAERQSPLQGGDLGEGPIPNTLRRKYIIKHNAYN
jgi:hypothetical protein